MEESHLRWAPPDEVIRLARESGFTTIKIVRIVGGGLAYQEALKVAHDYAPPRHYNQGIYGPSKE